MNVTLTCQDLLAQLQQIRQTVEQQFETLSEPQIQWKPAPGKWSVLRISNVISIKQFGWHNSYLFRSNNLGQKRLIERVRAFFLEILQKNEKINYFIKD